ncbi:MAG TPA: EscU/YscU/HrcU family type III secretion system export apparatus switch protein [Candidatus Saccharimonadales bacterium]|nr:EscU/YscU/HrcU family type III secretion system export apparatus switch protein [Candidatus Saccharimonadales bacterium]
MSERSTTGEKTEQPTPRKLEEALKQGQIPTSAEVQTAFVFLSALAALTFAGPEIWRELVGVTIMSLGHLHDTPLSPSALQGYAVAGTLILIKCAGPVVIAIMGAGLLAGAIQSRFNTASEALTPKWERLNPVEGFKRVFSFRNAVPTLVSFVKLGIIIALTYTQIRSILSDPIFTSAVSTGRVAQFLAQASLEIFLRICLALLVVAAADYGYQWWRNHRDLMMTKQELKEELKNTEGGQQIKSARRRRRRVVSKIKQLAEVPKADVVVTNPTHIAVALRYDRKIMRAPRVVAKGIRLNAETIREVATKFQVPIVENKPLARMLFKRARVGGEIPAELYATVAEVLAWVYRVNRYRYYAELNQA